MPNFRLVILDYPKIQLNKLPVQQTLSDLIVIKQKNFERTDPNYVVMDKHDMIGTHFMVYEISDLFSPQLIFALRVTYEDRAAEHKLKTPLQDLIVRLDEPHQNHYNKFKHKHGPLVDCNSWFVDQNFSLKESGLKLSDIGYTMVYLHIKRLGFNHIAGCTNERYKASRWLNNIGTYDNSFQFVHPVVPDPHLLILIENFKLDYIQSVYQNHLNLFENLYDLSSESSNLKSIKQTGLEIFKNLKATENLTVFYSDRVNKAG